VNSKSGDGTGRAKEFLEVGSTFPEITFTSSRSIISRADLTLVVMEIEGAECGVRSAECGVRTVATLLASYSL
jgi:hypothetical protein